VYPDGDAEEPSEVITGVLVDDDGITDAKFNWV